MEELPHLSPAKRFVAKLMPAKRTIFINTPGIAEGWKHCGICLCEGNSGICDARMRKGFFNHSKIQETQSIVVIAC